LTAPHRCHACKGEIPTAFGLRQHTIVHEECLRLTSIYAAVYFCPNCRPATLLESPCHQWGQAGACPACGHAFTIPREDVLREVDPQRVEGEWFSFACPACRKALECNKRYSRAWVVCLHCLHILQVPSIGSKIEAGHTPLEGDSDPRRAIQQVGVRRCPGCNQHIPRGCARCPVCSPSGL
jgi:hypothetical protein